MKKMKKNNTTKEEKINTYFLTPNTQLRTDLKIH